ncbi:hypothetical protein D3C85_1402560 [compost metagenome]
MVGTANLANATIGRAQLAATVQADIVESPYGAILLTGQQVRTTSVLVHHHTARLQHLFLAGRELPDPGPHPVDFLLEEFRARIAIGGERLGP